MKDGERGGGENWDRGVERDDGRSEEMARLKNRQREREIEEEIEREIEGEQGGGSKENEQNTPIERNLQEHSERINNELP